MATRLFRFFIYSNLFIAGCAVLMVNQTYSLLLHNSPNLYLLFFVLFSTLCSYSFHWYLSSESVIPSERLRWIHKFRYIHILLFFIGLAGVVFCFYYLLSYWFWLLIAAVATFLYSAPKIPHRYFRLLRRIAIGKTIFLAFIWMYVTSVLPVVVSGQEWNGGFALFAFSRFFLIYSICVLFDYRDKEDDKAAGVRSLVTYLGEKSIMYLFCFSMIGFFVSTLWLLSYRYDLLSVIILLIPGIITAALYNHARRNFSDIFYYFVLDGLMAFSGMLMLIPGI